jgi:flagellar protein FliS
MRTLQPANPYKSYRQIATQTAPPGQLVLMLFDGALKSLDCALAGFANPDFAERNLTVHNNLQRATDIIRELNSSLDMEAGGQLAATLRGLYGYFEQRITTSNFRKEAHGVNEVLPMIKELRDSWSSMLIRSSEDVSAATSAETNRLTAAHFAV